MPRPKAKSRKQRNHILEGTTRRTHIHTHTHKEGGREGERESQRERVGRERKLERETEGGRERERLQRLSRPTRALQTVDANSALADC